MIHTVFEVGQEMAVMMGQHYMPSERMLVAKAASDLGETEQTSALIDASGVAVGSPFDLAPPCIVWRSGRPRCWAPIGGH
ncbi:hypothetical protein RISK_005412 [Rhodopirellula islandica]|uniref:Uncharacterized protein n=1 Tax=Rhodopirellula islandica TaxID=595434 RepID=A0A0J1B789_RHOIS|nr:hypothetical protein [Rhodopirellula islandica]KLU02346.1 hypothetical protein RISK_005412 [Rhodopirellula islandica]